MPAIDPSIAQAVQGAAVVPRPERVSFSIQDFCWRNDIGTGTYHKLKNAGLGPDEMRFGNVIRITAEAELKWQRARTYPKGDEAKAKARSEAVTVARGKNAGKLSAASPHHVSKRKRGA
jgi:hypothetical protein